MRLIPRGRRLTLISSWYLVKWQHDSLHKVRCAQARLLLFTLFFFFWQDPLDSFLDCEFFLLLGRSFLSLSSLYWLFSRWFVRRLCIRLRCIVFCNFHHHWFIWQKLCCFFFRFFFFFWGVFYIIWLFLSLGLFLLWLFFLFFLPLHFFFH